MSDRMLIKLEKMIFMAFAFFQCSALQTEMGLEPVPLHFEHIATNQSRNHYSTHLGQNSVAGGQARFL